MKRNVIYALLGVLPLSGFCWDGYDYDQGTPIEIEKGNLVRDGEDIEVYDYQSGEYKTYEVESVSSDEVEVFDYERGETRVFDMD